MTAPALTYSDLVSLRPCSARFDVVKEKLGGVRKWSGNKITAQQARDAGISFVDIVWAASAAALNDKEVERRLRLWGANCAARVLHIYEEQGSSLAPRKAIVAARRFAMGEISNIARARASEAAWNSVYSGKGHASMDAARAASWAASKRCEEEVAWAAARAAAISVTSVDVKRRAVWDAEREWQFDQLVMWLSDNEPEDWPLPEVKEEKARQ